MQVKIKNEKISQIEFKKETKQEKFNQRKDGYFEKLKKLILANIVFEIKNFHLRFEDNDNIIFDEKFSFGISFELLSLSPSDVQFNKRFINKEEHQK